ncbi:MAG TPA: RidA family protein [bacterium]|nr:RidA family protein [bacterium]
MEKREVRTDNAPEPVGPYSQAVISGNFVFCSGQIALDSQTGNLVDDNIEKETTQVMENLKAVLESAGSSLEKVVKTTIFLTNMGDFARVNEIYGSYFGETPPARATIQAARLPKGARVEIDCIALTNG